MAGQAWSLRTLGHAAYITPDAHPLKGYFVKQLDNNLNQLLQLSGRCELSLFRSRYLHNILLEPNGRFFYQQYTVGKLAEATEKQKKKKKKWLFGDSVEK